MQFNSVSGCAEVVESNRLSIQLLVGNSLCSLSCLSTKTFIDGQHLVSMAF